MKGIYWRTLTFQKSVIYLVKVNYTSYNYMLCNGTLTHLNIFPQLFEMEAYLFYLSIIFQTNTVTKICEKICEIQQNR